ncbi:acyl-homoserine-lactone synthase [Sphingomonas sp. DT-204]|uniref:acyl-homoserine-lactone synthase n=1 Tax=Sphingomonas sp. DT-204 TaxID=3396166 RepID=UPI003F1CAE59
MLHILRYSADWPNDSRLRAMYAARKRVFVDLLKWNVPVVSGRFEVDQFDGPGAVYLLLTDLAGAHLASARLLPATAPHILDTLFPHLCEAPMPKGPTVFEITRFCLDRSVRGSARLEVRNRLVSAIADHGVREGIETYTGVAEMAWLQQILAFGWRCRPLGLPVADGRSMLGALAIEIDAATPTLLAEAGVYRPRYLPGEHRHAA